MEPGIGVSSRNAGAAMSAEQQQNGGAGDVATSETDTWPFSRKKTIPDAPDAGRTAASPGCDRDAEEYNMSHPRRGVALIFNHEHFSRMARRQGSDKDCAELAKALTALHFEVRVFHDLQHRELRKQLDQVSLENHSDADCLLVTVLSHGDPGILHAADQPYPVTELWSRFTGDKCLQLAGKPKLFFIQACRGERVDPGVKVRTETDAYSSYYSIPAQADILVAYSTVDGFYSWRNPREGSWFVQALVEELALNGTRRDLLTLLTFVCRRVALDKQSCVPGEQHMDNRKQVPAITSMLTRLVRFR